jgi:hypothetical protein
MINPTHPKWRALRLSDEKSVEYLNRMFRGGWYIVPFGMDDVEYFAMEVPLETPKRVRFTDEHQLFDASSEPSMMVVVLNHGRQKDRQLAVYTRRDESGYTDMGTNVPSIEEWRPILVKTLDDGGLVTVYEKGPPEK